MCDIIKENTQKVGCIMNEKKIIELYVKDCYTLRMIADKFNTDHHRIKRILIKHGIEITQKNRIRKPFTDEHRRKISESSKGRSCYWQGRTMPEETVRKNMITHMAHDITLEDIKKYTDFEKLKFLTGGVSRNLKHFKTKSEYLAYIDRFYYDKRFNKIYSVWLENNKNKWYMPTLDHKMSKANGGNWELDNLQFLTWFENRAKAEMSQEEWNDFKIKTNTKSDLFI